MQTSKMPEKFIEVRELTKTYERKGGEVVALDRATFNVDRGDFVTITGKSGSGKTTLLLMLGGLLRPSSGQVIVGGKPVDLANEGDAGDFRKTHIGFIMQNFALIPYLTASENVGLALHSARLDTKAKATKVKELLGRVGLEHRTSHYPKELSAGQQQRVAIARALANDPAIILADEPTGNLDPNLGKEILDLLRRINRERQTTVLMVTHNTDAAEYGNVRFRVEEGQIIG